MRVENWQQRFWDALRDAHGRKFQWGEHDCVLFAARMVDTITGSELVRRIQTLHPYQDAKSAAEHIKSAGGLRAIVTSYLGEPVPPAHLSTGDVVLFDQLGHETLGIHDGVNVIGPGLSKLERVSHAAVVCGWKVP